MAPRPTSPAARTMPSAIAARASASSTTSAVAARGAAARSRASQRVAIVDCDVHQGNGTAAIFAGDDSVFTFSIHGARNFPFRKETSDLDVDARRRHRRRRIPAGTSSAACDETLERSRPQLAIYLAGADPYEDDRLGRLKLTKRGLARRDAAVLGTLRGAPFPVAITMAGGYAEDVDAIVTIHANTIAEAARICVAPTSEADSR